MSSHLDPVEIEQAKPHALKCPTCKANLIDKATEKICPVCGGRLPAPKK